MDRALGDVPARASARCSHGYEGYCHDEALPEERQAVESLHRYAFEWASRGGNWDLAERFASWMVRRAWSPGVVIMDWDLSRELRSFEEDPR